MAPVPLDFVTAREAARIMPGGMTTAQHVARLCRDGKLPGAYKDTTGARPLWIIPRASLDEYLPEGGRPRLAAKIEDGLS